MSNDTRDGAFNFGLFTFALLFLSSANLAFAESSAASAQAHVIVKSANDERDYAYFVLANKLQVVVISDPDTDKAAAALDVAVGSRSEPTGRQGLAHFLEHMLFLGTEKYPAAGEYQGLHYNARRQSQCLHCIREYQLLFRDRKRPSGASVRSIQSVFLGANI